MPAKTKRAGAAAPRRFDAIALLKADHREVEELFERFEKARGAERKQAVANEICAKLAVHAQVEEELLYPAARDVLSASDEGLVDEAAVEHQSAKELIAKIEAMTPADDLYDATVKVLSEYIDHHVKEEERELFPKLRQRRIDLVELGERIAVRRDELLARQDVDAPARAARRKGTNGSALRT
jgi:hemerythrin superfamily protein